MFCGLEESIRFREKEKEKSKQKEKYRIVAKSGLVGMKGYLRHITM